MRSRCWEIGLRSPEARRRSRSSRMDPSPAARIRAARVRPLGINRGIVAGVVILCATVLNACEPGPPPAEPIARQYATAWQKSDYQAMWDLLTDDAKAQVTPAGFTERLPRIADEMTLTSLDAKTGVATHPALPNGSPDPRKATIPLDVTFHTQRVGDIARSTALQLVMVGEKDKAVWRIAWTPEAILPHLTAGRLVRMTRLPTSRGRIVARDGTELATFIEAGVVGVITGQIRSEAGLLTSLSSALAMTPDQIKAKYTQSWVKPDLFVPIKTVPAAQLDALRTRLSLIEGVQVQPTRVRSYPSALASQTLGYLAEASEDEAKAKTARGVEAGDLIGKKESGLEWAPDRNARRDGAGAGARRRAFARSEAAARGGERSREQQRRDRRRGSVVGRDPGTREPAHVRPQCLRVGRRHRHQSLFVRSKAATAEPRDVRSIPDGLGVQTDHRSGRDAERRVQVGRQDRLPGALDRLWRAVGAAESRDGRAWADRPAHSARPQL